MMCRFWANALSLTYGPQALTAYAARADFPVLAANIREADGKLLPGLQSHVLLPLGDGRKLGVIGLTVADFADIYSLFGLHLLETIPLVQEKATTLRQQGADVIVVISHMGVKKDRELAATLPDIDVIIGGHSHTTLPQGEEVNGVLIAQTGEYAVHLGRVDLTLDDDSGQVLTRSAVLLPVPPEIDLDPAVQAAIAAAEVEAQEYRSRPLGTLQAALGLDHFGECDMGNWAADVLRERMQADAAIVLQRAISYRSGGRRGDFGGVGRGLLYNRQPAAFFGERAAVMGSPGARAGTGEKPYSFRQLPRGRQSVFPRSAGCRCGLTLMLLSVSMCSG